MPGPDGGARVAVGTARRAGRWRPPAAALTFLTRVPVARRAALDAGDVARGMPWFPVVGAALGAVVALCGTGLAGWLPAPVAAALAVTVGVAATGGMHLDALADSVDALGAPDRTRALEVMRDPRVGSFGAVAIGLALVVRVTAVAALLDRGHALVALPVAYTLARAVPLVAGARTPSARAGAGAGGIVTGQVGTGRALSTLLVGMGIAVAVGRLAAVPALVACGLVTAVWVALCRRRFGGATGDTLGANIEFCELAVLVLALTPLG